MRVQTLLIAVPLGLFLLGLVLVVYQQSPGGTNYEQRITVLRDDLSSDIEFVRSEVKELKSIPLSSKILNSYSLQMPFRIWRSGSTHFNQIASRLQ